MSDGAGADIVEELLVEACELGSVGAAHDEQGILDVRQGRRKAEVDGGFARSLGGVGHYPTDEVAQEKVSVDFLENANRGVRAKVLDVQSVLPLAIDGLDSPAAVVQINQFLAGVGVRIHQRGDQPTGAKAGGLIANQAGSDLRRQPRVLASGGRGGVKRDQPLLRTEFRHPFGKADRLVRDAHQEVGVTQADQHHRGVGKKSLGRGGEGRRAAACE